MIVTFCVISTSHDYFTINLLYFVSSVTIQAFIISNNNAMLVTTMINH